MRLKNVFAGLRSLFHKERFEQDLDAEVGDYIEASTSEKMRAGMDREEALRAAHLELGSVEGIKEEIRVVGWERALESLWQDIRYAARLFTKDFGYTSAVLLALAIGIGANTALFTLFSAVALKPLAVPHPEELVSLSRTTPESPRYGNFSFADYLYYRDHNTLFAGLAAESPSGLRVSGLSGSGLGRSGSEPVTVLFVTANYFSTYGVHPILGREFRSEEDELAAGPYPVLLSENYWDRRFGRDPGVLGQVLALSGFRAMVIGVTPRNFMGTRPEVPDIWIILSARGDLRGRAVDRTRLCCALTGRLKPGAKLPQAQAELLALAESLRHEYQPAEREWNVHAAVAAPFGPNHDNILRIFVVLQIAMGLVLLIACTNVAGLLLGKSAARQREIAVRLSLGATRRRLVRQMLTEGVFIAVIAGFAALLCSWQALALVRRILFESLAAQGNTLALDVTPDFRVFLYTLGISALGGISFALAPALQFSRPELVSALKEETAGFDARRKHRMHGVLVALQIAVCLALLIGAGLLTSSSTRLLSVDPGFETRTVLNITITGAQNLGYSTVRAHESQKQLEERLRALPGVVSLCVASRVPLGGNVTTTRVTPQVDGSSPSNGQQVHFPYSYVSSGYFQTLGIPLLRGRPFSVEELTTNAPVAVISDALAHRFWPDGDALGKRLTVGSAAETHSASFRAPYFQAAEIVGIAHDIYSVDLNAPDPGAVYLPRPPDDWNGTLLVRVNGEPESVALAIIAEFRKAEPRLTVSSETLRETIASGGIAAVFHVSAIISAAIGIIGFVLAAVGVYALVAYSVSQQTREVGIRMALGARPGDVVGLLLKQISKWVALGLLSGAALGVALSLSLSSRVFLQGARILDPGVIAATSLLTGGLAILAAYFPVRRATALDPAVTLRFE
ncbi:MAG TPA: ABC transporter permease [Candidatus Acidoferrales bacterium]|nr:ABC transporter permease [Candidatus Acidoferrales bacterium]